MAYVVLLATKDGEHSWKEPTIALARTRMAIVRYSVKSQLPARLELIDDHTKMIINRWIGRYGKWNKKF